jgi:hypothetical protein
MQSLGCTVGQELCDQMAAMNRGPIPNDDQTAGNLAEEVLQKGDHICRIEGMVLVEEVQFALRGQGADGREMITGAPLLQDRGVAYGGIGPDHTGQGIKARFVYE